MMTRLGYAIRSSVPSLSGRDAMTLTLAQARSILDKTLAAAREKKFKPLGVAVVDSRGALRAYAEEDGNPILRSKIASGKAFGSVAFGTGSRRLHQIGVERPHMAAALVEMTGGTLVPVPGGVLIRDKAGALMGAVGVSGDTSDNDEAAAVAGIEAAGFVAETGGLQTQSQHLRVTALLLQRRRRSPLRAFEHGLRLHHVNREAGDEVDEAEHGEEEQGRRRRPRHKHELAGHGDEQNEREQMVDGPLAAGPHRFEDLDVEQQYADRDDKIADRDRHAVVEEQRQGRLGGERKLEYRAFLLIAERHVEEKNDDVEERKRDEQEGESDQVHDGWLSSRGRCKKNAERGARRDARSLEHVHPNWNWAQGRRQTSFFDLRTCRPRYMPVLRSMWWGRRSSPESLSST